MPGTGRLELPVLLSVHEGQIEREPAMIAYMMMAILALLAFLCFSHVIPDLTRRKK